MTWVAVGVTVVGGVVSAYGQYKQGQESKTQQEYNAKIAEEEAGIERASAARQSTIIGANATLNTYRKKKQQQAVTGSQIGAYAGRGVKVSTGSPLDVMADSIANSELEIAIGEWNARNDIETLTFNAEVGGRRKESEAIMRRRVGQNAADNSKIQAAGTLLKTAGSAAGKSRIGQ